MDVAEDFEVGGWQSGMHGGPAGESGIGAVVDEDWERDAEGDGREQADGDVHVGDGRHAGYGGEEDDEGGDEDSALDG